MFLVNGESKDYIQLTDRGLHYGDGLFETITVLKHKPVFLDQHLHRLGIGCHRLHIPLPDTALLKAEIAQVCQQAFPDGSVGKAILKLIITRGSGGRGYRLPDSCQPTRMIGLYPFPDYPADYPKLGITLRFCNTRLGLNPDLAGIKHLNRLEQVMARSEWDDAAIQEGVMLDINGNVVEGTMSNLFYVKNKVLNTPPLTQAGVAGIARGLVIAYAIASGMPFQEHETNQAELLAADEIFVCNSVIGIWPVTRLGSVTFPIGAITQKLRDWLGQLKLEEVSREA